ncbi:hypothetical protein MASR2M17_16250 [Aminivibrio sp.]
MAGIGAHTDEGGMPQEKRPVNPVKMERPSTAIMLIPAKTTMERI